MVTFRRSPFGGCGIPGHQRHGDVFGLHDRCSTAIHLQLEHAGPNRHSKMALGRQKPTWSMANQWPQLRKVRTDIMILCCHHATQKLHQDLQKWCWFFQCCLVGIIPISSAPIHCWWSHRSIQTPGGQHSRPSTAGSKGSYSAGHRADDSPRDSTRSTNRNQPDRLGNARSSHAKPLSEVQWNSSMKFSVSTVIHLESSGSRRNTAPNLWQNHAVWHIKSTAWSGSPDGQVLNRASFRHSLWPIPAFKGTPSEVFHQSSRFIELVLKLGYLVFLVDMIDYR